MTYRIIIKTAGIKQFSEISNINTTDPIKDICYSDKLGFFFISNHCIGRIHDNKIIYPIIGKIDIPGDKNGFANQTLLNNPSSICFNENSENILIVEKYGRNIRLLNVNDEYYSSNGIPDTLIEDLSKIIKREYADYKTSISCEKGTISWCCDQLNMCFIYRANNKLRIIGNGQEGYSIANIESDSRLNSPRGISIKGDEVYISDWGNGCIRSFGKEHKIICGHPIKGKISPQKIISIGNNIIFIDKDKIMCIISNGSQIFELYSSNNIISICKGPKDKLAILEKI